ncbi:MAG TPA: tape measure protein, partial [Kofleriaceae bacterium]
MAALAEAFVRIRPDTSTFKSDAEKGISKAGPGLAKEGARLGDRVGDSFSRGVTGRMTLLSRVGGRSLGLLATGAKAAGLGLAAAGVSGAAFGLKTAASMEQARISFTTMLGGAKQADAFLRQLQKFAAQTPFEFPELQTAASSLISVGVNAKDVIPIMKTLGDVTSGMGTGSEGVQRATVALQQMSAAGKITGEDLNQLRDAGVPVFDLLAGATGKTKAQVAALAQAGKLGKKELDQLFAALKTGKGLERFNGLMQKQSRSLSGIFSTLKDNVSMTLANLVTPAIPAIEAGLNGISSLIQAAAPHVQAAFQSLATGFSALVAAFKEGDVTSDGFVGVMERIGVAARTAFDFFKASVLPRLRDFGSFIKDTAIPALVDFGGWLVKNRNWLLPLAAAIAAVVVVIKTWIVVTKAIAAAQAAWAVVQKALNIVMEANPIARVVAVLFILGAALVTAYKTSDTFRGIVQKAWAGIQVAISFAWNNIIKPVLSALSGFIRTVLAPTVSWLWRNVVVPAFNGIKGIIQVVWPIIRGILQTWWAFIRNVLAPIITWLWRNVVAPVFGGIKNTIATVWDKGIKPVLTAVGNFIKDKVAPAFSAGVSAIGRAWDRLKSLATAPVNFVIGTVLNRGIFAAYNWVVSKF